MHASALVDMVQWLGGGLCYLYELFTLLRKKTEPQFMACVPRGVGCWTGSLTDVWGSFVLMHGRGRTRQPGVGCGWVR
jgi:hypothetical protein